MSADITPKLDRLQVREMWIEHLEAANMHTYIGHMVGDEPSTDEELEIYNEEVTELDEMWEEFVEEHGAEVSGYSWAQLEQD